MLHLQQNNSDSRKKGSTSRKLCVQVRFLYRACYYCVMKLFIGHQSALEYWRLYRALPQGGSRRRRSFFLPNNLPSEELFNPPPLAVPLHVMLSRSKTGRLPLETKQHVFKGETPTGCFVDTKDGYAVSSPEFCFLQLASQLPLPRIIQLGYELCGKYSIPTNKDSNVLKKGYYDREPLTSVKELQSFLERMSGVKGHQMAMRALRYLHDGSASPMETKLAMLLTLPYKMGGYSLCSPELNYRIVPTKAAIQSGSKSFYSCDLFWPDYNLAAEYDSDLYHDNSKSITKDAKKRNVLSVMRVTVITVTREQVYDREELENVARTLASHLDKRLLHSRNPGFAAAHRDLHKLLLSRKGKVFC